MDLDRRLEMAERELRESFDRQAVCAHSWHWITASTRGPSDCWFCAKCGATSTRSVGDKPVA
jgi:hypothetical protein